MSQNLTRVIVTTDMEVDDMNSLIHLALYLNVLDVQAVAYTASQYHFLGDGVHTLGEVNSHWRTKGRRSYEWAVVIMSLIRWPGSFVSIVRFPNIGSKASGVMNMPRLGRSCRQMRPLPVSRRFPRLPRWSSAPLWEMLPLRVM